jgi:hypothetical protein
MPRALEMLDEGLARSVPQHWQRVEGKMTVDNVSRPRPGSTLESCAVQTSEQWRIGSARADEALIELWRANYKTFNTESLFAKRIC